MLKKIYSSLICFGIFILSTNLAYATYWEDTKNATGLSVFIDTDSIYKYKDNYVYTIKYVKDGKSTYTQIILKTLNQYNLAAILSVEDKYKDVYEIPSEPEYKRITSDKAIYNSTKTVLAKSYVSSCSQSKCIAIEENPYTKLGATPIQKVDWGPYMVDLEKRIKRNWNPPKGNSSKHTVVTFTVGRNGRVLSNKVTKSSGNPLVDKAAIDAIYLAAPFKPLPAGFKGESIDIKFTFNYNVINGNQNGIYNKNF